MQGISTKVTAATLVTAVITILQFVFFEASWGFEFPEFPVHVQGAVEVLAVFFAGYLVAEGASTSEPEALLPSYKDAIAHPPVTETQGTSDA